MHLDAKKLQNLEGTSRTITQYRYVYITNFKFLALFGGEIGEEQHLFEVKSRGKPHISQPNASTRLIFGYVIQLQLYCRLAEKGEFFAFLNHLYPLRPIGAYLHLDRKKLQNPDGTSRTLTQYIYITNFRFLALFGGELCEEQTPEINEMKKPDQNTTSLGLTGVEMRMKSPDLQKVHPGHLLNVRT